MTGHIPPHLLLPQDMVVVEDRGGVPVGDEPPADAPEHAAWLAAKADRERWEKASEAGPVLIHMHATEFRHAASVEPDRYVLHDPEVPAEGEVAEQPDDDDVDDEHGEGDE